MGASHKQHLSSPNHSSKDFGDIQVVSSRLGDGHTQLRITERTDRCDGSGGQPHDDSQTHRASILQDPLGAHKDPRSNDVTWGSWREIKKLSQKQLFGCSGISRPFQIHTKLAECNEMSQFFCTSIMLMENGKHENKTKATETDRGY